MLRSGTGNVSVVKLTLFYIRGTPSSKLGPHFCEECCCVIFSTFLLRPLSKVQIFCSVTIFWNTFLYDLHLEWLTKFQTHTNQWVKSWFCLF